MADNVRLNSGAGGDLAASDEVTYSGDTAQVQLTRVVSVTGAEGSKSVTLDACVLLNSLDTKMPAAPAQDRTTAAAPSAMRLSDGSTFIVPALETGGNLATLVARTPATGQATMANSRPVVLASDQTPVPVQPSLGSASGNITTQNLVPNGAATANSAVEIVLNGAASLGIQTQNTYTGALSVQITFDGARWETITGAIIVNALTGVGAATIASAAVGAFIAPVHGALRARVTGLAAMTGTAAVNLRALAAPTAVYAFQPTAANLAVTANLAASQTLATLTTLTGGAAAEDAATSSSPHIVGGVVRTANAPTTLVAGDAARLTMTSAAQVLVKEYAPRQLEWTASLALTTTTAQPLAAAGAAGIFNHLTKVWLLNTGASAIDAFILDGTTERVRYTLPPNVPVPDVFPTGITTTAATALNINLSAAGTVRVIATGYTSA